MVSDRAIVRELPVDLFEPHTQLFCSSTPFRRFCSRTARWHTKKKTALLQLFLAASAAAANVHGQTCEARCGTQVGFLSGAHPPLHISYEVDRSQQCRQERCGVIKAEVAELKAAPTTTIASNADLAARLHTFETRAHLGAHALPNRRAHGRAHGHANARRCTTSKSSARERQA